MTPEQYYALSPYEQMQAMNAGIAPPGVVPPAGVPTGGGGGGELMTFGDGGSLAGPKYSGFRPPSEGDGWSGTPMETPAGHDSRVVFDQGPSNQTAGYTGDLAASDFGTYLFNSMTPEQQQAFIAKGLAEQKANPIPLQAPQRAYVNSGGDDAYISPEQRALKRNTQAIDRAGQQNDEALARLEQLAAQTRADNQAALTRSNQLIDEQDPRNAAYVQQTRQLAEELGGYRDTANQGSLNALGNYTSGLNQLNARNDATINQLTGTYDQLRTPLTANLVSQAAIADPQALAAQNEALGMLGGTANGALDYTSQAAGAYADPRYVAMRDQGLADLYEVSQGSKDVHVGQEDPAAYAYAMDALQKASDGTNPAVSDAENFLYEQARQGWEMDQRGLDAAKMSNLRRRGMAGGGAELTQNALGSQQIAQQRVLSDLAASAQAVARAQGMLQLQGQLGTQLNSEANALATGNANRQLQALGMYEQGSEVAQQSSFDQAYKRGMAADQASRDNQATRLSGQIAYGNQANAMQDDAYNRGVAADQMAQYNKNFEQAERDALWGRSTDLAGAQLNASAQNSNNLSNSFNATTSVLNNNYVRDAAYVNAKDLGNQRENQGNQQQLANRLGVQGAQIGVNNTGFNQGAQTIGQGINNTQWLTGATIQNNGQIAGSHAANNAAMNAALAANAEQHRADNTGIFGLPIIGSRNGLLGGFGIGRNSEEEDAAAIRAKYGG